MLQAFAPRMPRGFSWVWLAIMTVAIAPRPTFAQAPPPGEAKPKVDDAKPADKDDKGKDEEAGSDQPTAEVFVDPNAKKTLQIFNPLTFTGQAMKPADSSKAQAMAARNLNTDLDFLKRYVEFYAAELTKRDNLNALINPSPNAKPGDANSKALERAVDSLIRPLIDGKANNNRDFLDKYQKILFESSLIKVLDNNMLARIDAMIVLGMAGSTAPIALDLYTNQLKKEDQIIWVKLWAARGLTNAAQHGKFDIDTGKAYLATEALTGFLDSDPKLAWPAQVRALEALGSLRIAVANTPRGKIDATAVPMRLLADPDTKTDVRAWAAWSLGMMRVPSNVAPFNFPLVGHEIGELTLAIGKEIIEEFDADPANFDREKDEAAHLTSLLIFQVYSALIGDDEIRESGLIHSPHPNASPASARPFLSKLDDKIKAVTREAYDLLRAGGAGNKGKRNDLEGKLADLKTFLAANPPKDRHLVPNGPEISPHLEQQVAAGAPGR